MIKIENIKTIQDVKYYTGAHPEMRALNKVNPRPSEFGHKVWDTSFVLIDFLAKNDFNLNKKSVLEIGCGWGILGLYLAKHFDCEVTCSDLDEKVLPIVEVHAKLNSIKIKTKALGFKLITDEDLKSNDIIVGAEVCYSEEAAEELNNLIGRAYQFGVEQIFIADPGRPDFLEIICENNSPYKKEIHNLPGTKNGKVTRLLHFSR
jgi:predicted nicotinamide N-methyase